MKFQVGSFPFKMLSALVLNVNSIIFLSFLLLKEKYLLIDLCNNICLPVYPYGLSQNYSGGLVVKIVKFI